MADQTKEDRQLLQMLVIADDLSGAADCGVAFASRGLETTLLLAGSSVDRESCTDVLALDANTRDLPPAEAAYKSAQLVSSLCRGSQTLLYKKVDSTLRGNVAAELAACITARRKLSRNAQRIVAVLAPAFPENGRTTIDGKQHVNGMLLDNTESWKRERMPGPSSLPELLQEASLHSVLITLNQIRHECGKLGELMQTAAQNTDVLVCDAETDGDLAAIGVASVTLGRETVWAGSAGLAHQLAGTARLIGTHDPLPAEPIASGSTLFVIGSPSAISHMQVEALSVDSDTIVIRVPLGVLLAGVNTLEWREREHEIVSALRAGKDVAVIPDGEYRCNLDEGRRLCRELASMVKTCESVAGALVATGGETARAVLETWGISELRLIDELQPGVAFSIAVSWQRRIGIITKAGSFGDARTLLRCRDFLHNLERNSSGAFGLQRKLNMERPIIAITMGDAAGVGPEIIVKALAHTELRELCRPLVIGDAERLKQAAWMIGRELHVRSLSPDEVDHALFEPDTLDCIDLKLIPRDLPWGKLSARAGDAAFHYVEVAANLALNGKVAAICTAPINKEALHAGGHNFPGHTELLACLTGTEEVSMMLSTPKMRVLHVTTHIGLIDAIAKIEPGLVERTIARGHTALERAGIRNPRIAVCGINPHAGENGLFGYGEENEKIAPAVERCRKRGWDVEGPLAADTVFFRAQRGDFDLVVAMYHDQGHGPVKVLGLESGVNITIGLPVIRTSVDHGTAFDIAGTGVADERSMVEAIRQATQLAASI